MKKILDLLKKSKHDNNPPSDKYRIYLKNDELEYIDIEADTIMEATKKVIAMGFTPLNIFPKDW